MGAYGIFRFSCLPSLACVRVSHGSCGPLHREAGSKPFVPRSSGRVRGQVRTLAPGVDDDDDLPHRTCHGFRVRGQSARAYDPASRSTSGTQRVKERTRALDQGHRARSTVSAVLEGIDRPRVGSCSVSRSARHHGRRRVTDPQAARARPSARADLLHPGSCFWYQARNILVYLSQQHRLSHIEGRRPTPLLGVR